MGAPRFSEVVVIRYTFVPHTSPDENHVSLKHQKFSASGTTGPACDWYSRVIFKERYMLPAKSKVLFSEWHVFMSDEEFFKVNDISYDEAIVILGVEQCYWKFYKSDTTVRHVEGVGILNCTYCACCIEMKYDEIAKATKELLK